MIGRRAANTIVGLVATIWAINFLAGLLLVSYEADQAINGIFMAIVGGALALGRSRDTPPAKPDDDDRGKP